MRELKPATIKEILELMSYQLAMAANGDEKNAIVLGRASGKVREALIELEKIKDNG